MATREYVNYSITIDGKEIGRNHKANKPRTMDRMNFLANVLDRVDSVKSFYIYVEDWATKTRILERKKSGLYGEEVDRNAKN